MTGSDPTPTIPVTSTSGGTFTITAPGVINPATGEIDLSASGLTGSPYTITYNTAIVGNACPNSTTVQVAITTAPSAAFTYDQAAYCQDSLAPVLTFGVGASGGLFSSIPAGLSLNTTSGAVDLTLSTPNVYTVYNTIAAGGGCAASLDSTTIEVLPVDSALFSYSNGTYCLTGTDPAATIGANGTTGGTFTISAPGVINPVTGQIDLLTSGLGTYTIYYNTAIVGNACSALDSLQITITSAPSAVFTYDQAAYCQDSLNPILTFGVGASGGVFSSTPAGLSLNTTNGAIDLILSTPNIYTVYNTIAAGGGCAAALDSTTIEVLPVDSALFSYSNGTYCLTGTDPAATIGANGTTGGTFTISAPGVINPVTGQIDLLTSGLGTYTIYYNTAIVGNACSALDSLQITITSAPSAVFTYDQAAYCQDSLAPVLTFGVGASGGVFSSVPAGLSLNTTSGSVDLTLSTPNVYTVYNTIAAGGGCSAALDSAIIEVLQVDSALFSYSNGTYCLTGTDPIATIGANGTTGGTFTISTPGVINANDGTIDLGASGLGTYTIYYNTTPVGNSCPALDSLQVTITSSPTAAFIYDQAAYCQDSISPVLTVNVGSSTGVFSASPTGLTIDAAGNITLSTSTPGIYTVYNNVAAGGGCSAVVDSTTIEVLQVDDATFSFVNGNSYCEADANPTAILGGTTGGVFTILPTGTINAATGEIDLVATGVGSYTVYYNTIAAGNSCPEIDSLTLTITAQSTILADLSNPICLGDVLSLTATGSGNGTITWYSDLAGTTVLGTGSPFAITPSGLGTITYYVNETGTCPSAMDSVVVIVGGVVADINANPLTGSIPLNVTLDGTNSQGAITNYGWSFGNGGLGSQATETVTYANVGAYTVQLIVTDGICSDTTSVIIDAFGESAILIPNVFTPNNDGSNDVFTVDGVNLESVECDIYNRWGQLMHSWTNAKGYWDGRTLSGSEAPDGSYFYIINAKGFDGTEYFKKGSFSLIR